MTFKNKFSIFSFLLFASFLITSCSKEDSITTTVEEEEIKTEATFAINNRSITSDSYAAYCMDNGKEFIAISNNPDLLKGIPFEFDDLVINDYVIQYVNDPDGLGTFTLVGSSFGADLGFLDQQNLFNAAANLTIDSNDGTTITGSTDDTFLGFNQDGELFAFPYSITFVAEIVDTPDFCN